VSAPDPAPRRRSPLTRGRSLLRRIRGLLFAPDQIARLAEEQLETRQQLLHENTKLRHDQDSLREVTAELKAELGQLAEQARVITERVDAHRRETGPLGRSLAAIGEALAAIDPPDPTSLIDGPLVSVVLPMWNRAGTVGVAVRSVLDQTYPNWELLVVDDASGDGSRDVVEATAEGDARVRMFEGPGRGAPAARNTALRQARGELVAYLDSDNRWLPTYLAHLVRTYRDRSDAGSVVTRQLVVDDLTGSWSIRDDDRPVSDLERANFIDLNAYSHRRDLFEQLGGFDERLLRLSDWDLARRYVAARPLARNPWPGSVYRFGAPDQISRTEPAAWHEHLVRRKHGRPLAHVARVLLAEWHYPQLSESYVQSEIDGLTSHGAAVEVWSEEQETAAPFATSTSVHRGSLEDAISEVRPDLVMTHWLHTGANLIDRVAATGVPMVVRGHGFDYDGQFLDQLTAHPSVRRIYLFPHFYRSLAQPDERIRPLAVAFDAERYTPAEKKDRLLVVRSGVAIPTKAYGTLFEVAQQCPDHRFVLCLVHAHRRESYLEEVRALRDEMDAPVDIHVDVPHDQMREIIGSAGIYLHTHGLEAPFGMPISIAESMGTGSYVIARDLPGCRDYLGDAGALYRTSEEAAQLVRTTQSWSDERWRDASNRSIERAFSQFTNVHVAEAMLRDWHDLGIIGR
jgi:glycosyltransferase involved in cell wall biosynthesis